MFASFTRDQKEKSGMTDVAMARELGFVGYSVVWSWRKGKNAPSLRNFQKVMRHYEVDKDYAKAMWEDILADREKARGAKWGKIEPKEPSKTQARGTYKLTDEFYQLERELIKDYEGIKNVPDDNKKLLRIKEIVGGAV